MLAEDLPAIPLWNYSVIAGHSTNVANLKITPFSTIDILSLELASVVDVATTRPVGSHEPAGRVPFATADS